MADPRPRQAALAEAEARRRELRDAYQKAIGSKGERLARRRYIEAVDRVHELRREIAGLSEAA
jgi:hypothetical protein